jgi:hypothetical protein
MWAHKVHLPKKCHHNHHTGESETRARVLEHDKLGVSHEEGQYYQEHIGDKNSPDDLVVETEVGGKVDLLGAKGLGALEVGHELVNRRQKEIRANVLEVVSFEKVYGRTKDDHPRADRKNRVVLDELWPFLLFAVDEDERMDVIHTPVGENTCEIAPVHHIRMVSHFVVVAKADEPRDTTYHLKEAPQEAPFDHWILGPALEGVAMEQEHHRAVDQVEQKETGMSDEEVDVPFDGIHGCEIKIILGN